MHSLFQKFRFFGVFLVTNPKPFNVTVCILFLLLRYFVCMVGFLHLFKLWIRSELLTESRKFLMMDPCVTFCGLTLRVRD